MKHPFMGLATLLGGFLGLSHAAQAQGNYVDDALLYTRQGPSGTARTLGLAGASSSLGGDFGSLTTNPAGLGVFTKSEFSFTPGLGFANATASPFANAAATGSRGSLDQSANSFHVASLGLVFANRRPDSDNTSDWRGGSFALGFTRLADFNQGFRYQNQTDDKHSFFQFLREPGGNPDYTTTQYQDAVQDIFSQNGNQGSNAQYINLDGLAYGGYLTNAVTVKDPNNANGTLVRLSTPARTGPITQNETVLSKGSLSQFDLGYGGNYRDKLYIGGGVGIVSLNHTRTSTFSESSNGGEDFNYQDYVHTTGTGINARLGLIYRVVDAVRLGASIQTPTYIHLTDDYSTTLTSQYAPANVSNVFTTVPGTYEYSITTPFRATGGATVLLSKYGFLTGDIEYVGYQQARFHTTDGTSDSYIDQSNDVIAAKYKNAVNLRFGVEGRLDVFRARLGYAYYQSPYAGMSSFNRDQNYFTGGLGVRTKSFFVDVAGVFLTYKDRYSPYTLATGTSTATNGVAPVIDFTQNRLTTSITGGLIF